MMLTLVTLTLVDGLNFIHIIFQGIEGETITNGLEIFLEGIIDPVVVSKCHLFVISSIVI